MKLVLCLLLTATVAACCTTPPRARLSSECRQAIARGDTQYVDRAGTIHLCPLIAGGVLRDG